MKEKTHFKKYSVILFGAVLVVLLTVSAAFSNSGVLLKVNGKVTVKLHGATSWAKTGMRLQSGAIVESQGGSAAIFISNGKIAKIAENASYSIPVSKAGETTDRLAIRLMYRIRDTAHRGRGVSGREVIRDEREIGLVYPFNSFVFVDDLFFKWENLKETTDTEIVLKCPSPPYKFEFKAGPDSNNLSFPENAPPLNPGVRYYWRVKSYGRINNELYASKIRWFSILDEGRVNAFNADKLKIEGMGELDDIDKNFLMTVLMIDYQLYHKAVDSFKKAFEKFPGDQGIRELLIGLYMRMKQFEEAEKLL